MISSLDAKPFGKTWDVVEVHLKSKRFKAGEKRVPARLCLQEAIGLLPKGGGVVLVHGPGKYTLRKTLRVPEGKPVLMVGVGWPEIHLRGAFDSASDIIKGAKSSLFQVSGLSFHFPVPKKTPCLR